MIHINANRPITLYPKWFRLLLATMTLLWAYWLAIVKPMQIEITDHTAQKILFFILQPFAWLDYIVIVLSAKTAIFCEV